MIGRLNAIYYRILRYQPETLARIESLFDVVLLDTPADDSSDILAHAAVLFAPLGYPVDRGKIDACPNLRVIVSNTTGHPHIDVDYARQRGIYVACLKFAPEFLRLITPTAELTWGLVLALTRHLIPANHSVLQGHWDRRPFAGRAMLSSMTLGIVGHGRLGSLVTRYARAFGMVVRYYDPNVTASGEGAERVDSLDDLVGVSDIVSLHVPHEKETAGLISREVLHRFKRGSYLINTARGELLDWHALIECLESGHLAGAALDVFEGEFDAGFSTRFPTHPVLQYAQTHDNLVLTPHIGGSTLDAWRLTEAHVVDMAVEHLRKRAEGSA